MLAAIPEWVESHGKPINGLDLTGLRLHDLIWNPNAGWGGIKCVNSSAKNMDAYLHLRGDTKTVAKNFFIYLRLAAEKIPELKQWVSQVFDLRCI